MMKPILDATAGNRHIHGENKHPDNVVFMDKEPNLRIPPDVVATWDKIPYPDDYFHCVIFDPPHVFSLTSMYNQDPKARPNGSKKIPGWYGAFASKRDAVCQIIAGQKEFARVAPRICFKWNEASLSIDRVLTCFTEWDIIFKEPAPSRGDKPSTWWVKMVRKGFTMDPIKQNKRG